MRFKRPYVYTMEAPGLAGHLLTVKQAPFSHEGFASTGAAANDCAKPFSCIRRCSNTSTGPLLGEVLHVTAVPNPQDSKEQIFEKQY